MVEVTNNQLLDQGLRVAYTKIGNLRMNAKNYYSWNKIGDWLGRSHKECRESYIGIVKKYANLDEHGVPKDNEGKWDIPEDKMEAFTTEIGGFMQQKVSLDWSKIDHSDLEGNLTANEWRVLEPFITN